MSSSTWLVTGAARGIGFELVRQLLNTNHRVIAVCRNPSAALEESGATVITGVDLAASDAPSHLVAGLDAAGVSHLDAVVMNAGVYPDSGSLGSIDYAAVQKSLQVNAIGQLALAEALLPRLESGSRLAFITSRMGSIADNTSGGSYGYRMGKAALNMAARSLAVDLKPRGIPVIVIHPGFVRTDMTHGRGLIDADTSAAGIIARVDAMTLDATGSFWHQNGDALPW